LEELTWLKLTGLALSLAGLGILVSERHAGQQSGLLGDLLNTCGVLAFAYYVILGKQTALRFDSLSQNTFMFLTGGAMMLPLTASAFFTHGLAQVTWRGWLSMLYMAAFSSVAAYLIFYYALKHVSATRMSALSYLQPPCATFLSWMLLKEPVTAAVISGAIVIFVGVFMTEKG
jgi:drug/metabolite transporter (DMT)-like permease